MEETLEQAAEKFRSNNPATRGGGNNSKIIKSFIAGIKWQQERTYSEEDMLNASKYGYNFHKTTLFPNQEFEDSCINNTKQWLTLFKKK